MKFILYLKDKMLEFLVFLFFYVVILLLFFAFKVDVRVIVSVSFVIIFMCVLFLLIDYFKRKSFYNDLVNNIKYLDKAFLVLETLDEPNFYEGKLVFNAIYDINKSMIENLHHFESQVKDFKDYVEMWIHEVKIPLSSLTLTVHNHKDKFAKSALLQMKKIDDYLEQILYYTRSENASKDYCINKISLNKCVNSVLLRNKDYLLESDIVLSVSDINYKVYSDSKWLEFILNQIINNSIKYRREDVDSFIKIYCLSSNDSVTLVLEDNGVGISEFDLPRVFDKTFTGSNGRNNVKSTGMGLFIVKNLCAKLGHKIIIDSVSGEYTKVFITISKNEFYDVLK